MKTELIDIYQHQIERLKKLIANGDYQPKRWLRLCSLKREAIIKRDALAGIDYCKGSLYDMIINSDYYRAKQFIKSH